MPMTFIPKVPFYGITKLINVIMIIGFSSLPAHAHDFWLSHKTYHASVNTPVDISVMVGHPIDKMAWPVDPHRIIGFRSLGPLGLTDHQASITSTPGSNTLPIKFNEAGLHILSIETTHSFSELKAKKFNDYVEEEGLLPIKIDRALKGTKLSAGKEIYSRRGKALIQIGPLQAQDPAYLSKPIGMTLEIVPLQNPARIKVGDLMHFKILYRGVPIKSATVGLIDLEGDQGLIKTQKTNAKGQVKFARPKSGSWMLHVVWSDVLEDTREADYDTIFSSLSFAVE